MVRLLHTSDWHLGRSLHGRSLLEDQSSALQRVLELIDRVKPHALLIAGDVFDRQLPPEGAVSLFDWFLAEAAGRRDLPIFIIPGNHDSCERLGFASGLLRQQNVTIFARLSDAFLPVLIQGDEGREVLISGIPFVEPLIIARLLGDESLLTPHLALSALSGKILAERPRDLPHVLLSHAYVVGSESSESERELFIGGSSLVQSSAFAGFDYVALGHLHKPQAAGGPNCRYSGSLLQYSKSEVDHIKSVTEVEIGKRAEQTIVQTRLHAIEPLRRLRSVEGPLQELLTGGACDSRPNDFIIATYTDSGAVLDGFLKLRALYPNLLHVARAKRDISISASAHLATDSASHFAPGSVAGSGPTRAQEMEQLTDLELFGEFFAAVAGERLNEHEETEMARIFQELNRVSPL